MEAVRTEIETWTVVVLTGTGIETGTGMKTADAEMSPDLTPDPLSRIPAPGQHAAARSKEHSPSGFSLQTVAFN